MPALSLAPGLSFLSSFGAAPLRPLHTLVRTAEERFHPRHIEPHSLIKTGLTDIASPIAATILRERSSGKAPTIVLGGLVPDATEQVFLLRRFLLKSGDIYYVQYPRDGFSLDTLCRQLGQLVDELCQQGTPPIVFAISFGAGIVLEWLRRHRLSGTEPVLAGIVLVSPISCPADLVGAGNGKPATLLGRALRPYLDSHGAVTEAIVEKSRMIFVRMFEAGAQNKLALHTLMTRNEVHRLRTAVMATIRGVSWQGAVQRVQALAEMPSPVSYFSPAVLPLCRAPTLILFAEREEAVLDPGAPVRLALQHAARAYFGDALVREVTARSVAAPVQHASLVFHVFDFLPHLQAFYQRVRRSSLALAA